MNITNLNTEKGHTSIKLLGAVNLRPLHNAQI